jgi:hypothetical protein
MSANGDTAADPNKLVMVNDVLGATSLPALDNPWLGTFHMVRSARAGETFRGVALAQVDQATMIAIGCSRQRRPGCATKDLSS